MTSGPPCPNCGAPLRWFPQAQQWGCDRERIMLPREGGAKKRSRKGLWIGLGAVAVIGAGVGAALLFTGRSSEKTAGGRDELVRATFASLAAGDQAGLESRAGLGFVAHHVTCANGEMPDVSKDRTDFSEQVERAIGRAKGATFEIVSIDEPEPAKTTAKGTEIAKGCKLDLDMVSHHLAVTVKITRAAKTTEATAKLAVAELKGTWYTMSAPMIAGGCDGAIARIALVGGRDANDADLANKLQPPMIAQCESQAWSAAVIDCLTKALGLRDVLGCAKQLTADQQAKLRAAIAPVLAGTTPAASVLRNMVPPAGDTPATPATPTGADPAATATLGKPEPADVGDFWLVPRADGAYVVTSSLTTATFPEKPAIKVEKGSNLDADGKPFDIYSFAVQHGDVLYQLQVIAFGRNARDQGGLARLEKELSKLGKVTRTTRTEDGQEITQFAVTQGASTLVVDGRLDLSRGLIVNSTTVTDAATKTIGEHFLASVHVRHPKDPLDDPDTLVGVRVRKAGKKLIAHDKTDQFTIELPWQPKVARTPDATSKHDVEVSATATKGKAKVVFAVAEVAPWDALAKSPTRLAALEADDLKSVEKLAGGKAEASPFALGGLPGSKIESGARAKQKVQSYMVWNRFQHRMYRLLCIDTPCDALAKSLHFADPAPQN